MKTSNPLNNKHLIGFVSALLLLCAAQVLKAQPTANFTIHPSTPTSGCPPHTVKFRNLSTGATSYLWDFGFSGPGGSSTLPDSVVSTVYYSPGQYTVKLIAKNGSQTNTMTKTLYITVYDTAKVDFSTTTTSGCAPLQASFSNLTVPATGNTYQWVFQGGNPTTSSAATPTITYSSAGSFLVTLKATTSHGCVTSKTKTNYITIKPKPTVNFTGAPLTFCGTTGNVNFTSSVTTGTSPYTYSWSFGSTAANPTNVTFNSPPTSHTVKLSVTDANGCTDSGIKSGYINFVSTIADFQAPSSICLGTPINFINTTAPCITASRWDFNYPSIDTSNAANPFFSYLTPGTKTVQLITWCGNCPDTITKQIIVYPLPHVDFTTDPDSPCPAPIAIKFIPNTSFSSYTWTFGSLASTGGSTSNTASPVRTYTANGFDTVSLSVTDSHGCTSSVTKSPAVKIFDLYAYIGANKYSGCIPLTIQFFANSMSRMRSDNGIIDGDPHAYPYGDKTYEWIFDNGPHQYTPTPSKTYTVADSYKVIVKIKTNNDCEAYDTIKVAAGTKPQVSYSGALKVCYHDGVKLINTAPQPHNEYKWIWRDGTPAGTQKDGLHVFPKPGTYKVSLINYYNGCPSDTFTQTVTVDSPKAVAEIKYFCHPDSLRYIRASDSSLGSDSVVWIFGDGQISNTRHTYHQYGANGTYILRLAVYNKAANCWDTTADIPVNIFTPVIDFAALDTAICLGDTVHLHAVTTGFNAATYTWIINNSYLFPAWKYGFSTLDTALPNTGFYKIGIAILDEHLCEHTVSKNNYLFISKPTSFFNASSQVGCVPMTVNFSDASTVPSGATITNRAWSFPGGLPPAVSSSSATTSTTYLNAGTYDVKLIVTDNVGCKDTIERIAHINAYKPVASFAVVDTGCLNTPITFFNNSTNFSSSSWSFGDNTTSGTSQPDHSYSQLGTYDVRLIVTDVHSCRDTMTLKAKVTITKPFPSFTVSDSVAVCAPLIVNFTNTTTGPNNGAYAWLWDFGNGQSFVKDPVNAFITPGTYKVKLIATTTFGCKDSVETTIRLYGYSGSLDYTPKIGCVPLEVDFTPVNLFNIPKLTWDFTDGTVVTTNQLTPIKHTYTTSGSYLPKLILEDVNGCKTTSPGIDSIKVDESYADFTSGPACEYQEMEFFDNSNARYSVISVWNWRFDTTGTSLKKDPTHLYGPPGQYDVRLIVKSTNGCYDTISKTITVNPLPTIDAGSDTVICLKDSAMLYPSGGVSYVWTPNLYLSCDTCPNPLAGPLKEYTYKVIGTDANGCKNDDTVHIGIKTKVVADVGPGAEICDKDTFTLHAYGAKRYEWTPRESLSSYLIDSPIASPHVTTNYIVVAYEGRCIPDTHSVKVIVHPLPTVNAEGATTIVAGNSADLRASGDRIIKFEWSPAENLNCTDCAFPTAKPSQTTIYTVRVYSDFGCVDSDNVTITVLCDKSQLFIPNTFTPNGDGQNDVFYPRGKGMDKVQSLRIYNRWGEMVYQRTAFNMNDQYSGWDGTFRGQELPPDVFVWIIEAVCDDGKILTLKGDVTIIR